MHEGWNTPRTQEREKATAKDGGANEGKMKEEGAVDGKQWRGSPTHPLVNACVC